MTKSRTLPALLLMASWSLPAIAQQGLPGDAPPRYAPEAGSTRCSAVGRDRQCGGGLDIIGIGFAVVRGITQALANRD